MQDNSSISGARPLRSRATTDGLDRAPHRAFLRAADRKFKRHFCAGALAVRPLAPPTGGHTLPTAPCCAPSTVGSPDAGHAPQDGLA